MWNAFDWTLVQTYSQHSSFVIDFDWLSADTLASTGSSDGLIKIWSLTTGQTLRTINSNVANKSWVYAMKLLNNKIHLAVSNGYPSDIQIYNVNNGSLVYTLKGNSSLVSDLIQISDDLLACSCWDNTVIVWNLTSYDYKFILQGHTGQVYGLKQINTQIFASSSGDRTIKLWNITSGELVRTLTGHTGAIFRSLDLLNYNGGQLLVSGANYGDLSIKLWNWSTGECLSTIPTDSRITTLIVADVSNTNQQTLTTTTSK